MIAHISDFVLSKVLELYNKFWEEGNLPVVWEEAIIISIKKPGKNSTCPDNYRP